MIVTNKQSLAENCLRRLGAPVINIEIDDSQIDDIIDDVIQLYQEIVFSGSEEVFLSYKITQADIDAASLLVPESLNSSFEIKNNFIVLPESITSVIEVISRKHNGNSNNILNPSIEFLVKEQILYNKLGQFDLVSIPLINEYLGAIRHLTTPEIRCRFNYNSGKLYLDQRIEQMLDCYIIIRCTKWVDPNEFARMWNSRFIKDLTTIKLKKQWGQNISKYSGVTLAGGIKFNADQIINTADKELDEFMSKMTSEWTLPATMLIG